MKLLVVLMLCAVAAAAPQLQDEHPVMALDLPAETSPESRNILVNLLVRQLIEYIRRVIKYGSVIFGLPPLDPLHIDDFNLKVPAGLFSLDLKLKDVYASGIGDFVVHKSNLNIRQLTFDIDISVPSLYIKAGSYELDGDLFSAIPLFGDGDAEFQIDGFRFQAMLYLGQSEDEKSVILDRIENTAFEIPSFKSNLSGVIGGGDIDAIVNAIVEEVIVGYVRRFHNVICVGANRAIVAVGNPILEQLDTWRFIAPLL